jgi:hypothetical protein
VRLRVNILRRKVTVASQLRQRVGIHLGKVEALTNRSGRDPHSPAWTEYWMNGCHKAFEEGEVPKKAIPLEAIRAWMQARWDRLGTARGRRHEHPDGGYPLNQRKK